MLPQRTPRQRLLESLRFKKAAALGDELAIRRRDSTAAAPLSFAQQRLWFLEQLEPGNPRFNILTAVRLKGHLRLAVLGRALDEIVRRHEVLRTTFEMRAGQAVQVVSPGLNIEIPIVDLSGVEPVRANALLLGLVSLDASVPFDFERGPLLRVRLVRLAEDHQILILTMHQIVVDRWSRGLLIHEVVALYEAFSQGQTTPLPELAIQYSDFAVWQREYLRGEVLEGLLGYWRQHLMPPLPVLEIPTDYPRSALQGHRGRMQYYVIPEADLEPLKALARGQGATLFMVLFAAVSALLHRYSGQEDIVIGSPIANRNHKETESLIGFFLNLLALRLQVQGDLRFHDLVQAARSTAVAAFEHQDMPFERLVEELALDRDLSRHPLFTVTMVLQNAPMPPLTLRDLTVSLVEVDWGTTAFDLSFFFWETALWESLESGLSLVTNCNADLFDPATITRMIGHFKNLLRGAAEDPGRSLSALPLLSAAERQELVADWNDTSGVATCEASIPALFADRAACLPEAIALTYGKTRLTYRELDRWSDAVARRLLSLGVGRGGVVGIIAERSSEAVVGFLGILKTGAAYVPIPAEDPAPRQDFLLRDSGASALLVRVPVSGGHRPGIQEVGIAECRDDLSPGWRSSQEINPAASAAFLYTSGSTGTPKGACIPHSAIVRLIFDNGFLTLTPEDRVAQVSNLGFDAAAFEIWASLLTGAELVGCDLFTLLSAADFSAFLTRNGITTLFLTTALFDRLAREDPRIFAGLNLLIGGEVADPGPVREVLRHGAPGRFLQMYGPTEGAVFSSFSVVSEDREPVRSIPLGRPVGRSEVHVLDTAFNPTPVGVRGRIHVGGAGVARGYVGCPELTAERFVPDPFCRRPGDRLFDTGDLGRRLWDGEVEFCGRADRQIKWRGLRIEPGEIEAALTEYPGVHGAVVLLARTKSGEGILVAYVVAKDGDAGILRALPASLRERLPSSMIPSRFELIEAIPLTPRGKVDVQKLSCRDIPDLDPAASFLAPRTDAEKVIADVWREVLGRDVGIFDDFFDTGGHSLQASQICARLSQILSFRVPVRRLFERRTVAGLAEALEGPDC